MIFSSKAEFYLNSGPPPLPTPPKKINDSFVFGQSKKNNRETAWCKKPRITLEREKN